MRRYSRFDIICGFLAAFGFLAAVCPLLANADIYQWKDASGKVHFSDKKPENRPVQQLNPRINSFPATAIDAPAAAPEPAAPPPKDVVMYSTQRCGYCKQARAHFKQAGIAYREYDIDASESARRRYEGFGANGVPLIFVGKARMDGFSEKRFDWLYKQQASRP